MIATDLLTTCDLGKTRITPYYVSNVRGSCFLFQPFPAPFLFRAELTSQLCDRYVIYPLSYHHYDQNAFTPPLPAIYHIILHESIPWHMSGSK